MAFNFAGGSAPTPTSGAPAPAPATGPLSFGGAPAASAPAPAALATATTGSFSFGATAPATASTTTNNISAAAAAPVAAPSFGFGGSASASVTTTTTAPPAVAINTVVVPEFRSVFPNLSIISKVRQLLSKLSDPSKEGSLAGQELTHVLRCSNNCSNIATVPTISDDESMVGHILAKPRPLTLSNRNDAFRNQLQSNPMVTLHGKEAGLTPQMLIEIWKLADDLRITELDAMTLYAGASDPDMRTWLENKLDGSSFVDAATAAGTNQDSDINNHTASSPRQQRHQQLQLKDDVPKAARELFFYERGSALTTILLLLQHRIQQDHILLEAIDHIIQANLLDNLVTLVTEYTQLVAHLEQDRASKKAHTAQSMFAGVNIPATTSNNDEVDFALVLLNFAHEQRQLAATCLFYLTYHTQCIATEVASLIDLIQNITNGHGGVQTTNTNEKKSGLPLLDPLVDVPRAHLDDTLYPLAGQHQQPLQQSWAATPLTHAPSPPKEKDPLVWHNELVRNVWQDSMGKPQLLQCVSILTMSVIAALDCKQILVDRNTHRVNEFGLGNALLRPHPGNEQILVPVSMEQLAPIHTRLDPRAEPYKDWKRKDIWGLLASSYALLLRPVAKTVASPRLGNDTSLSHKHSHTSPGTGTTIDVKATSRACLEIPTHMESFRFARLCMMPSFPRHSCSPDGNCNDHEFLMSVLSEFCSEYLDVLCTSGDMPSSRKKWEEDQENELHFLHHAQERQRSFQNWQGATTTDQADIPTKVDLTKRPDCMDDLISLCVAVCSTGPEYANSFWSVLEEEEHDRQVEVESSGSEGEDNTAVLGPIIHRKLAPSCALETLERVQESDDSLMSAYVSFLAALALADDPSTGDRSSGNGNGADIVHQILLDASGRKVTWASLISTIRWYVQEMESSSSDMETLRSSSTTPGVESTSYYYGTDRAESYAPQMQQASTAKSAVVGSNKPQELGEVNTMIILSYLNVISSVASNSKAARSFLVSMTLPFKDGVGEDPIMTVLFSLAMCPLSPEVRGAVFVAISSLLRSSQLTKLSSSGSSSSVSTSEEEKEWGRKAWGLLEQSQTLPIAYLYQYAHSSEAAARVANAGIRFPPSSTAQVGSGTEGIYATSWVPPDTKLGIIYEMEQVESRMGCYPSTEGLLHLLTTLISVSGCPSDLGRSWRPRSGCTPYIEYVTHFVLPRAIGLDDRDGGLPFRTLADKSRLVTLAFEVVEAVICQYNISTSTSPQTIPLSTEEIKKGSMCKDASKFFGLSSVDSHTFVAPDKSDEMTYSLDFRDVSVNSFQSSYDSPYEDLNFGRGLSLSGKNPLSFDSDSSVAAVTGDASFPAPKSPGFGILADIFSVQGGDIFKALVSILSENSASQGIYTAYGLPEHESNIAQALFGQGNPTFSATKSNESQKASPVMRPSLLKAPFPAGWHTVYNSVKGKGHCGTTDGVSWRERSIILALRIFCASAAREEMFLETVNAISIPLKIVPVIRFRKIGVVTAEIESYDVQLSRLTDLLHHSARIVPSREIRVEAIPTIVGYIGYVASTISHDADIASSAMALLVYIRKSLPTQDSLRLLCSDSAVGAKVLTVAMSNRLDVSSKRIRYSPHAEMVDLILDLILLDLRFDSYQEKSISHIILGFPIGSATWQLGGKTGACDSLTIILGLLSDADFITTGRTSAYAAKCYEIIYRISNILNIDRSATMKKVLFVSERLRDIDFWYTNLLLFLGNRGNTPSVLEVISSGNGVREGDENILHCISWLFKGVANELRVLMGISLRGFLQGDPLFALAAPKPRQCRKLLSLLYEKPFALLVNALNFLPLSKMEIITETVHPPAVIVEASVSTLPGPNEVVHGYSVVSLETLQQMFLHHQKGSPTDIESAMNWAKQWNKTVAWECAVSHLADSWRIIVGASFAYCKSVLIDGSGTTGILSKEHAPLDTRGLVQLLSLLFARMTPPSRGNNFQGTNDALYSSATLRLAMAAFVIVEELANTMENCNVSIAEGDALRISVLLARAIISSSSGVVATQSSTTRERTVVLGSALALIMQLVCENNKNNPGLMSSGADRELLLHAAVILSRLASNPVNGLSGNEWKGEQLAAVAHTSRSALSALFRCHNDDASTIEESFIAQALSGHRDHDGYTTKPIGSLVALVGGLDDDISVLLEQIASRRYGTEILQDAGLLAAMSSAANSYRREEEHVKAGFRGMSPNGMENFRTTRIGIPSFLSGHMSLLNIMLATPHLSQERRAQLATDAAQLIRDHADIISRLMSSFPSDGDVTIECMRCMFLTLSLMTDPSKSDGRPVFGNSNYGGPGSILRDEKYCALERRALDLTYHISQYPFPEHILPLLPPNLNSSRGMRGTGKTVVAVTISRQQTWWDKVEIIPDEFFLPFPPTGPSDPGGWQTSFLPAMNVEESTQRWSNQKYELSIDSMEILRACLSYLNQRIILSPAISLDWQALAKGFCRCADAARAIEGRLRMLEENSSSQDLVNTMLSADLMDTCEKKSTVQSTNMEQKYLFLIGPLLGSCAEKILVLALATLRNLSRENYSDIARKSVKELSRVMSASLDHTQVESMGMGCVGHEGDENDRGFAEKVASVLRQELQDQVERFS